MKFTVRACAHQGCRRKTTNPGGLCFDHDHRSRAGRKVEIYRNGALVPPRPDGLTEVVEKTETGTQTTYRDSSARLHRLDGPAVIYRDKSGQVVQEVWFEKGVEHRLSGPAETSYEGGRKTKEIYRHVGNYSRIDGPAVCSYDPDGNVDDADWFLAGNYIPNGSAGLPAICAKLYPSAVEGTLRSSPLGPLLDEGHTSEEIVGVIATGVFTPEGVRAVLGGAPAEWVRSFEEAQPS